MPSTKRSLVLGLAASLPPSYFEPFVRSLRDSAYQGRVGLVLGHYGEDDIVAFNELVDFTVVADPQFVAVSSLVLTPLRTLRSLRGVRRIYPAAFTAATRHRGSRRAAESWRAMEFHLEGLQSLRYAMYRDAIRLHAADADQILLSDVRDVLFQGDPFERPLEGLEVFLEEPTVTIGSDPYNRRWIKNLHGAAVLRRLAHQTVSCSGTVIGTREALLAYLDEMDAAILRCRRPLASHDQGIHNHLLRTGRLPAARIVPNGAGRVLTMGAMVDVARGADGSVVNADGSRPEVVHQYDRHHDVARDLLAQLAGRSPQQA